MRRDETDPFGCMIFTFIIILLVIVFNIEDEVPPHPCILGKKTIVKGTNREVYVYKHSYFNNDSVWVRYEDNNGVIQEETFLKSQLQLTKNATKIGQ